MKKDGAGLIFKHMEFIYCRIHTLPCLLENVIMNMYVWKYASIKAYMYAYRHACVDVFESSLSCLHTFIHTYIDT